MRALTIAAVLFVLAPATHAQQQHPYFPLQRGSTWTYHYPSAPDPEARAQSSETHKVVNVDAAENTYTVEHTTRLATLPPDKITHVYEVRGGNVLDMGQTAGMLTAAMGMDPSFKMNFPAPIVLKANLTKGMHWEEGPTTGTRACEVMDFVTVKVPAGEYKNVAKLRVKVTYISKETGKEELFVTSFEYYAPNVGLVKTDVLEKDGRTPTFVELVSYTPGS